MGYSYLIPTLLDAPEGYDVTVDYARDQLTRRLRGGAGRVRWTTRIYHDGQVVGGQERDLDFSKPDIAPLRYVWRGTEFDYQGRPGYVENSFSALDAETEFTTKMPVGTYGFYSARNKPSFRGDADFKFGSPPVIATVARFRRLIEAYPTSWLDRERGYGESLVFINPYARPILANLQSHDGRSLPRLRVQPQSGALMRLEPLLRVDEPRWIGRLQITANNRCLIFHVRHAFGDHTNIVDHEHLDPFRADTTHLPAFQAIRQGIGRYLKMRFGITLGRM
ncbi:hypothetical protein [Ferrovibrio sp.]|uniref:hypothetical protein n=1 Tax=Ferrovibrio sp. TaxID=1917215 RepID=UPI0035AF1B00